MLNHCAFGHSSLVHVRSRNSPEDCRDSYHTCARPKPSSIHIYQHLQPLLSGNRGIHPHFRKFQQGHKVFKLCHGSCCPIQIQLILQSPDQALLNEESLLPPAQLPMILLSDQSNYSPPDDKMSYFLASLLYSFFFSPET